MTKSRSQLTSAQTVDKVAKPCRAIKRNSIRVPDKLEIWWGKGERNEVFIMNFKEIHSNTNFFRYRRARACSAEIKFNNRIYRKVWLEHYVQATLENFFKSFARGSIPTYSSRLAKYEIYLTFSEVSQRVEICNLTFSTQLTRIQFGLNTGFILSESFPVIAGVTPFTAL